MHLVSKVCRIQYPSKLHHFRALFTKVAQKKTSFLRNTSVGENELVQARRKINGEFYEQIWAE